MIEVRRRSRFAAIVNPISGRRSNLPVVRRVQTLIERFGGRLDVLVTERGGHATALAAQLDASIEALLIVGGDGTVSEVIQGLDRSRVPFLVFPSGTENLLARALDMPRNLDDVVCTLIEGATVSFDLGRANGRLFHTVVGIGFDAACVERMAAKRRGHITHFDYVGPIWEVFRTYRFPHLSVAVDGDRMYDGSGLVMVGNTGCYARRLRLFPDARWDDGLLDVVVFPCRSRWTLLAHALRAALRRHVGRGGVVYRPCRRLTVSSSSSQERVPWEIDGEVGGVLPVEIECIPEGACFLTHPKSGRDAAGRGDR